MASNWPVSKEVEDFLQKCDLHDDKHLEMYCNDHSQLCCITCAFLNHRQCAKVTLISESVKEPPPDLLLLARKIQTILEEIKKLQNHWETNMQSLQASYDKQLHEIRETRNKINSILDKIEKNTMKELDDKLTNLKASVKTDADNCSKLNNDLEQLSGAIHDVVDKGNAELSFIASKKCLEKIYHSETYLKENSVQVESSLTFQANSDAQQCLSNLSGLGKIVLSTKTLSVLGDTDQVFTVQEKSEYNVSLPSDSRMRFTITICLLSDYKILVADHDNKRVKLLNHQYKVVGHCDLNGYPWDMCKITSSEVAVTVDENDTHEVQFVSVNSRQLVKGSKLQFKHRCKGIAHNLQDMFLTSNTALYKYQYSMKGAPLKKLYEDTSGDYTVCRCAVSPSGDKIFVTNNYQHKVLTLARDGTVLHTFTDPDLQHPRGIHVTALGQVLVCGGGPYPILQLDGEAKKKLAILGARKDGLNSLHSACYNRSTASIIMGQWDSNNIVVFKVK